jgi:hypothetical protein
MCSAIMCRDVGEWATEHLHPAPKSVKRLRQPVRFVDEHPLRGAARFERLSRASPIYPISLRGVLLEVTGKLLEHHASPGAADQLQRVAQLPAQSLSALPHSRFFHF